MAEELLPHLAAGALHFRAIESTGGNGDNRAVNLCFLRLLRFHVEAVIPIHQSQWLSYRKLLDISLGLIINFNSPKLTDGISRLILPGANLD